LDLWRSNGVAFGHINFYLNRRLPAKFFSFCFFFFFGKEKEETLDHVSLHTTEGHFCSLLKSSVIVLSSLSLSAESAVIAILKASFYTTLLPLIKLLFLMLYPAIFLYFGRLSLLFVFHRTVLETCNFSSLCYAFLHRRVSYVVLLLNFYGD